MDKKIYLIWNEPDGEDIGYWSIFHSLHDAAGDTTSPHDIHVAKPRLIGKYKLVTKPKRFKRKK